MTHAPGQSPPPLAGGRKYNVLLVDDRQENLLALEASLHDLGQNLVRARSGRDALREILHTEFAVILLDVNMPDMDGYETAELIRQRESSAYTPIIFITAGNGTEAELQRAYALGAVDYLMTPLVPHVLRAKVRAFIDLAHKTDLVRAQEEWLRSAAESRAALLEARLQTLLNMLDVGYFRCSVDGRLMQANPAFVRITGLSPEKEGTIARLRHQVEGSHEEIDLWRLVTPDDDRPQADLDLLRPDGSHTWVSVRCVRTAHPGEDPHVKGLVTDIAQRKTIERDLQRSNESLQRSNEEMNRFVYAASHDLQEPLRMVLAYCELLLKRCQEHGDPQALKFATVAAEGARRMHTLLSDLRGYMQTALAVPNPSDACDGNEALEAALLNLGEAIRQSDARFQCGPLPALQVHKVHLVQLLQNLISNAIKYRRDETLQIEIGASSSGRMREIYVRDNGQGFKPQYKEQIFGIFKRLHGREYPGTGIGLALCSKLVESYGGRIWADSEPGVGSTFRFTLPAAELLRVDPGLTAPARGHGQEAHPAGTTSAAAGAPAE